ncbi:MAG: hypothetical protein CFE21_23145, partial [Bacteroidetes bacterium B1(2017)]
GIALFCAILYLSNVDIFLKTASRTYQNLNVFESSKYKQQDEMNTFSYRLAHFIERAQFVSKEPLESIFGLGFITENSTSANKLHFNVGLLDVKTNKITQIDTGDVVWSLLILQGGWMIIFLNILVVYTLYSFFNKHSISKIAESAKIYLLIVITLSFFSTELINVGFRCIILLILAYVKLSIYDEKKTKTIQFSLKK